MNAEYPQRFIDLLNNYKGCTPNNYIGQGNPSAKILIIGKECTAQNNKIGNFYDFEIKDNFLIWQRNYREKKDFCDVLDWDNTPKPLAEKYNPLFPYNSWWFGGIKNHGSKTWDGYQAIINHIYPEIAIHKHEPYNFWQYCFITELSTHNMRVSHKNAITAQSIYNRLIDNNGILQQAFFQQFPIIIFASYHYKDWYSIDIEECFQQKYIDTPFDEKNKRYQEFIHEHRNLTNKENPRLLLHTNHAIYRGCLHSEAYYKKLGKICRDFLEEYYRDNFVISK